MEAISKPELDMQTLRVPTNVKRVLRSGELGTYDVLQLMGNTINASADEVNKATDWVNKNGEILAENEKERIENENNRVEAFESALEGVKFIDPSQAANILALNKKVTENIDKVKEDADKSANAAEVAERNAVAAMASAANSEASANSSVTALNTIKEQIQQMVADPDTDAAIVAKLAEHTAELNTKTEKVDFDRLATQVAEGGMFSAKNSGRVGNLKFGDVNLVGNTLYRITIKPSLPFNFGTSGNWKITNEAGENVVSAGMSNIVAPVDGMVFWYTPRYDISGAFLFYLGEGNTVADVFVKIERADALISAENEEVKVGGIQSSGLATILGGSNTYALLGDVTLRAGRKYIIRLTSANGITFGESGEELRITTRATVSKVKTLMSLSGISMAEGEVKEIEYTPAQDYIHHRIALYASSATTKFSELRLDVVDTTNNAMQESLDRTKIENTAIVDWGQIMGTELKESDKYKISNPIALSKGTKIEFYAIVNSETNNAISLYDRASGTYSVAVSGSGTKTYSYTATEDCEVILQARTNSTSISGNRLKYTLYTYNGLVDFAKALSTDVQRIIDGDSKDYPAIVALNNADTLTSRIQQMAGSPSAEVPPLMLVHFSDIHGSGSELERITQFAKYYNKYLDDVLHTGDSAKSTYNDSFEFWAESNAHKVLNVIGNHDGASITSQTTWNEQHNNPSGTDLGNWFAHSAAECYNKYFAPYIDQWGVVKGGDNVCYYYKDYPTKKVRMIVLDEVGTSTIYNDAYPHWTTAQQNWLRDTLASAKQLGYTVVAVSHSVKASGGITKRLQKFNDLPESPFNTSSFNWLGSTTTGMFYGNAAQLVQDYINAGGKFACWLVGHAHRDAIGYGEAYPNQLVIAVHTASASASASSIIRAVGTKSQDAFNVVSIDTANGRIKMLRVGADTDTMLKKRDILSYDYINKVLISE